MFDHELHCSQLCKLNKTSSKVLNTILFNQNNCLLHKMGNRGPYPNHWVQKTSNTTRAFGTFTSFFTWSINNSWCSSIISSGSTIMSSKGGEICDKIIWKVDVEPIEQCRLSSVHLILSKWNFWRHLKFLFCPNALNKVVRTCQKSSPNFTNIFGPLRTRFSRRMNWIVILVL